MIQELDQTDWNLIRQILEEVPVGHYLHERYNAGQGGALSLAYWEKHFELLHFFGRYQAGQVVLDFGCGPGNMTLYLADRGFQVYGVDKDADIIRVAEILMCAQEAGTRNRAAFGTQVPNHHYDVCWIAHTLEHIPVGEWTDIFTELRAKCSAFEISVPIGKGYDDPTHVNHWFSLKDFWNDLVKAGMGNLAVQEDDANSVYRCFGAA